MAWESGKEKLPARDVINRVMYACVHRLCAAWGGDIEQICLIRAPKGILLEVQMCVAINADLEAYVM